LAREQHVSPAAAHPVSHSIRYFVELFHSFQSFQVYRKYTIYDLLRPVKCKHTTAGQLLFFTVAGFLAKAYAAAIIIT
jgi:hypothetical protein